MLLTRLLNYAIIISTKQKAVAPTKNEPPPIKKRKVKTVDIMKILLEKLQKLERMEEIANHAEADYERDPENAEYEATFDLAYQNEFKAYIEAAKYIEYMTDGNIDFMTAKKIIQTKRAELISILTA